MRPSTDAYDFLPRKFLPLCIGHAACKDPFAEEAWAAYGLWKQEHVTHGPSNHLVIDIGTFLLEGPYKGPSVLTPLYSMHKAKKLSLYLTSKKVDRCFFIQKQFIFGIDAHTLMIIEQKNPTMLSHQISPCLSSSEATAAAALIFFGFINLLNSNNCLTFTQTGKIVIVDPTPNDRLRKVAIMDSMLGRFFFDKALRLPRKLCLTALIKTFCPPLVKSDVEKIERQEYNKGIKYSIVMIAFYALSLYATVTMSTPTLATMPIKVGFIGLTSSKLLLYVMHAFNIHQAYTASMQREEGISLIREYLEISGPTEQKQS